MFRISSEGWRTDVETVHEIELAILAAEPGCYRVYEFGTDSKPFRRGERFWGIGVKVAPGSILLVPDSCGGWEPPSSSSIPWESILRWSEVPPKRTAQELDEESPGCDFAILTNHRNCSTLATLLAVGQPLFDHALDPTTTSFGGDCPVGQANWHAKRRLSCGASLIPPAALTVL